MKKSLNFKLIAWVLVGSFIAGTPGSLYCMEPIESTPITFQEKVKLLARYKKDFKLRKLVDQFRETKELRRKKKEGTATKAELKKLDKQMKRIKIAAAAIGVTLIIIAIIAAIVGGRKYVSKKWATQEEEEEAQINNELQDITTAMQNLNMRKLSDLDPQSNLWQDFNDDLLYYALNQAKISPINKLNIAKIFVEKGEFVKDNSYTNLMKQAFKIANQENNEDMKQFFKNQIPAEELQFEEIEAAIKRGDIDAINAIETNTELWKNKNLKILSLALDRNLPLDPNSKLEMAKILVYKGGFKEDSFYFRLIRQAYNSASSTNNEAMKLFFEAQLPKIEPEILQAATTIEISDDAKAIIPHLAQQEKTEFTWYEILNVPEPSDCDIIKGAYRKWARLLHPDKHPDDKKDAADKAFKAVGQAFAQTKNTCD